MSMKTKDHDISALSLGERVARDGVLTGRRGSGLRPPKGYAHRGRTIGCGPQSGEGSLPSYQLSALSYQISVASAPEAKSKRNEPGMSMKRKEKRSADGALKGRPIRGQANGLGQVVYRLGVF
jgi:hypothetical protein